MADILLDRRTLLLGIASATAMRAESAAAAPQPESSPLAAQLAALESGLAGARVVSVSYQEEEAAASSFARNGAIRGPVYLDRDGTFARRVGLATLPAFIVYRDGAVVLRGRLGDDSAAQIAAALGR